MAILNFILGPKLFREYAIGHSSKMYEPLGFEKWGEKILGMLSIMWNVSFYTSPILCTYLYRRGYFVTESISSVAKLTTGIGIIYIVSMLMRGVGRSQSPAYVRFIKALELSKSKGSADGKRLISLFDFDFNYWKVDFDVKSIETDDKKANATKKIRRRSIWSATTPCDLAAFLAIHTFGLRMIYPGSIGIMQSYLNSVLNDGRASLIEQHRAERNKLRTEDENDIDTIFVDNRNTVGSNNGQTLVICSEGNAGFYEIGIISTPLSLEYSVLGWNHPGFAGSTGKPFPDQDQNAMDAVIKFAIYKLEFSVENIILLGWSIGGYSSIWGSTQYRDIKGLVLDATFDDLLYLCLPAMPQSLGSVVKIAVRDYVNLHNEELIKGYDGPVTLIRRTHDEIIASEHRIETNRGNFLLIGLLKNRFPNIFETKQIGYAKMLLSKPLEPSKQNEEKSLIKLTAFVAENGKDYPLNIGEDYNDEEKNQMADFLIRRHMRDLQSDHCSPLPAEYFNVPWDIPI